MIVWLAYDSCQLVRTGPLVQQNVTVVTRLRLDAALYEPATFRPPGPNGRPQKKGKRLSTLRQVLERQATHRQTPTVRGWSGVGANGIEVCKRMDVWSPTRL